MEFVPGQTVRQRLGGETSNSERLKFILWDRVVRALGTLFALGPPDPCPPLGPVGSRIIEHLIFGRDGEYEDAD